MHGDRFLPLTSGAAQPQFIERHQWVAFLGSVGLHLLVLLSLPWLMQREPVPPPLEIEVQLEPEHPMLAQIQRQASHTSHAWRQHAATRSARVSRTPVVRKALATPPVPLQEIQAELKEVKKRKIRSAGQSIKLATSAMSAPAPAKQPGAAPQGAAGNQGQGTAPGPTLQANAPASLPPRPAYAGRQPSIAQASPPQPGENSSPGPRFLTGSTPAVQSMAPEYRHASRRGGTLASQGGAQQPATGLDARANESRQGGWQTAAAGQTAAAMASPVGRTTGSSALSRGETPTAGRTTDGGANRPGREPGMALAAAQVGGGSAAATRAAASDGGTGSSRDSGSGSTGRGGSAAAPGEYKSGGLTGSSGMGASSSTAAGSGGSARSGPEGSSGAAGALRQGASEGGAGAFQLAAADGGRATHGGPGSQHGDLVGGDAPINASFESAEESKPAMQLAALNSGSARLLDDRYTATSVKATTPTHFCEIPLMMAGLGAKPIPKGLDSIMPSSSAMGVEFPPRHLPGNQMPVYPLGALAGNLKGKVILRAEVLTSGAVGTILLKQSSGAQILDTAAYETVHHWRFQPAQRNGQPVVAWMTVPIEYRNPQTLNGANP